MGSLSRSAYAACAALGVWCAPDLASSDDPHAPRHEKKEIESIVVTGSPLDRESDELATSSLSLDRAAVLSHREPSLGETLAREPGMAATGFAAGASRPVIRGQDALRVQVLESGTSTHDVSTLSPDHGIPVNPLTAQRIEVLRGPATLRYGGGAIGGVVNALTGRVPRRRLPGPLQGELYLGYGFGAAERSFAFAADGGRRAFAFHLDGMRQESADFPSPDGVPGSTLRNSGVDGYAVSAGAAWIGERGRVGIAGSRFANEYGIPEADASIDLASNRLSFEAEWNRPVELVEQVRAWASATDYEHRETLPGVGTVALFQNDEDEARVEVLHAPVGPWYGALGLHYRNRDFEAGGEAGAYLSPTDTETWAAYVWEELALTDALTLQLGARAEDATVKGTPATGPRRTRRFHPLSVSVGLVLELSSEASLGLVASAMQRAPDAVELFARGPHEATGTFESGAPGLDEETSLSAELSLRGGLGDRLSGELGLFYIDYDDYIFGRETGRTCDEDGSCAAGPARELRELVYVQRAAAFYGGELQVALELFELGPGHLGVDGQLDVVRGRLDHGNVPRQPPVRYGGGVHWAAERVQARLGFLRYRRQGREGAHETETGGYTSVDAALTVRLLQRSERFLDLLVSARNLLDERGRNHLNFRKDEVPQAGRIVRAALHGDF